MDFFKYSALCIFINLSCTSVFFAQENKKTVYSNDLWTGISLKYKLTKKISFHLNQQVRITEGLSTIRSNFFEFDVKYKFNDYISSKVKYRYTIRGGERNANRYALGLNFKKKVNPTNLELNYRICFQHSMVVFTGEPSTFLRNKIQARYKFSKKLKPFIAYESFYKFNDDYEFRRNRYTAGIAIGFNKKLDLMLSYKLDEKINTKDPQKRNILAILLRYEI
ncbi:MAG: DUF2490 domain-containing protein [Crocinitomicaceae bacterium]|nr:DUF2490 domain-containing protein [Crocinitomicaceae bacterium]